MRSRPAVPVPAALAGSVGPGAVVVDVPDVADILDGMKEMGLFGLTIAEEQERPCGRAGRAGLPAPLRKGVPERVANPLKV